jgi:hypothetical protein
MRGKRLRSQAIGLGLIASCNGCGGDLKSYYPLDAGRTWSYALTIRQGAKPVSPSRLRRRLPICRDGH